MKNKNHIIFYALKLKTKGSLLFILLCFLFIGCNKSIQNVHFIPIEYQYPIERIGNGKSFFYQRVGPVHENAVMNLKLIKTSRIPYLLCSNYSNNLKIDSTKSTIDGKLLESYNFNLLYKIDLDLIKGQVVENKIIDDGSKYGNRVYSCLYKGRDRRIKIKENEKYLYDTIIDNNGLLLKCFVTEMKTTIIYETENEKIAEEIVKKKSYFGKNLGLFCYKIEGKDDSSMWLQMGISDIK